MLFVDVLLYLVFFFTKCLFTLKGLVFLSKCVVKLVHFSSKNNFYPLKDKKNHLLKNNFYYFCVGFKQGALWNADIIFYLYNLYLHRNENFRVRRFSLFFLTSLWSSVTDNRAIFAEDKLHSAIWKQAFIALIGIIFAFG